MRNLCDRPRATFALVLVMRVDDPHPLLAEGEWYGEIIDAPRGAVVGLDHARPVTTDLSAEGAQRYAQVVVGANAVRR